MSSRTPPPPLSDGGVVLRAMEPRDLPAIEVGIRDPDVIRWIGPQLPSADHVLAQAEERWAQGSPTLAICELDGAFLGKIWLEIRETDRSTGFIGYWLLSAGRGRGLATGAVRLVSRWAVRELGVANVRIRVAPENVRSQRVAERSGFRRVGVVPGEDFDPPTGDQLLYALDEALVARWRDGAAEGIPS